jgi:hypothetical protein
MISGLCAVSALLVAHATSASANTISVIDAPGATVYSANGLTCGGYAKGSVISTGCFGGPGDLLAPTGPDRFAFLRADLTGLVGLNFDHVYLSLTEMRSGSAFKGTANLFAAEGNIDVPFTWPQAGAYLSSADKGLSTGMIALGSMTGTGVGGNQLLFDVTDAVLRSLQNDIRGMGFLLTPASSKSTAISVIGSNYRSGLPACEGKPEEIDPSKSETCQYFAKSYYEYPTLIATKGKQITPFDKLPERPVPELPPLPVDVPEPGTVMLLLIGLLAIAGPLGKNRAAR